MKFTKKLVTVAATLCAAGALFLTGCPATEDAYGILNVSGDNCTINFTNDTDTLYARGFKTTKTNHLSADILLEIDTTETILAEPANTANNNKTYTAGHIFNLTGSGTESDPYSFALIGLRYGKQKTTDTTNGLYYYVSYYTGVLEADVSSNHNNFVVRTSEVKEGVLEANKAVEYDLSKGVKPIESNYYTTEKDANGNIKKVSVYISVAAYAGDTLVDDANYSQKVDDLDRYKIAFKPSATAEETKDACTMSLTTLNNDADKYVGGNVEGGKAPELVKSTFSVKQAKLGYYSMVKQGTTLNCKMTMSNTVKSASTGDAIIWDEEITNVR